MEGSLLNSDIWLLFVCLGLAFLADLCFFHGPGGISYIVFISIFYIIVFLRFQFIFTHRRIGLLMMFPFGC